MDATKLHLLFNYFPLIGSMTGLIALLSAYRMKSVSVQKIGLGLLALTAFLTLVVFGTGEVAGKGSDLLVGQVWTNIEQHKAAALPAFAAIETVGIFALYGLINLIRGKTLANWFTVIILVLTLAAAGLTVRTSYLGRLIHSVEVPAAK